MIATADSSFVHAFAHNGRWYAYDVNTNDLLEVDAALGPVLAALTSDYPDRELARLTVEIGREAVGGAMAEVKEAQRDEGLFSCHRPRIVSRRLTDADRAAYESRLSHLILSVTEDCNLACRYCPQAARRARPQAPRPGAMSLDTALQALTYFAGRCRDAASPAVSFYGGEPLLRFDLIAEVVAYARGRRAWPRLKFIIDTNGTAMDDKVAELVAREKLYLQISLDGPAPVHDRWRVRRDGRGSHAAVVAGLQRVLRRDPSAAERISLRVTAAPPVDLDVLAEWFGNFAPFRQLGLGQQPHLRFSLADLSWKGDTSTQDGNSLQPQVSAAYARWIDACACDRRAGLDPVTRQLFDGSVIAFYHRSRGRLPEQLVPGGCCQPGVRRLVVAPDGHFGPCERSSVAFRIGHAESGIDGGRVAGLVADFSRALGDRCRECWAVRLCSVCYAALTRQDEMGELVLREEFCVRSRERAATSLRGYADLLGRNDKAGAFLSETITS